MRLRLAIAVVLAILCAGNLPAMAGDDDLATLVQWMTGSFSSEEQSLTDDDYYHIVLEMVPIWTDRTDGHWLYVEQAAASRRDKPYRQRVYHITQQHDVFTSEVYAFESPLRFAGQWSEPAAFNVLDPDSLTVREGCAVVLERDGDRFMGATVDAACQSSLRGASYATSEVSITSDGIESWDRGYDTDGKQVWGAEKGAYVFLRQTAPRILRSESRRLEPLVESDVARSFLDAARNLPSVSTPRVVHYNRETRDAMTQASALMEVDLAGYKRYEFDEQWYYYTRYGTPLAFVRALDLVAQAGMTNVSGARIADFGFGSIGQLRILASLGVDAVGIEVDKLLEALYSQEEDTGAVGRSVAAGDGPDGSIRLCFGRFPAEADIVADVGEGYQLFVSKNTLKRGYIHPAEEVNPRMLVHLGVDDATYVQKMYDMLEPGGFAMIYNLHPAKAKEGEAYIPWADGRCPFARDLIESTGFTVVAFDKDDTEFARTMGKALGWDEQMNLETDLFATYTLLQRKRN